LSFVKPRFALLALMCAALVPLAASCGGDAFSGGASPGSGGSAMTAGSAGSSSDAGGEGNGSAAAGPGKACSGPEDCNDGDACTVDRCNAEGTCEDSPKCQDGESCCEGDCAKCCADSDCDDGVACTKNRCFMGQCMYVPNDAECAMGQYCAPNDGCRARQTCGLTPGEDVAKACDDGSTCTTDSCVDSFCQHDYCAEGKLCCEGATPACAEECCSDSQCDTDDDPCTVGVCTQGKCGKKPLCTDGKCCPSADKKTATCGACCSAVDCDDKVGCTADSCAGGHCSNTPGSCDSGYYCDILNGCTKSPDCEETGDCKPSACQKNPSCSNGTCHFGPCDGGTKCCKSSDGTELGCALCCADSECGDSIACTKDTCGPNGCVHTPDNGLCGTGQFCDPTFGCIECNKSAQCTKDPRPCAVGSCNAALHTCSYGDNCNGLYCTTNGCVECRFDADCQGDVIISPQVALPGSCYLSYCDQATGKCANKALVCGKLQTCCSPYGCQTSCNIAQSR
jgi:hypothetical protein